MHPAEQLQGQTSQCVRARVGGEEVASSSSGRRSGSVVSVAMLVYINGWTAERCWLIDIQAVSARAAGGLSGRSVGGCGLMAECSSGGRESSEGLRLELCRSLLAFDIMRCDAMALARCHVRRSSSVLAEQYGFE
jgi:hypothetical protein